MPRPTLLVEIDVLGRALRDLSCGGTGDPVRVHRDLEIRQIRKTDAIIHALPAAELGPKASVGQRQHVERRRRLRVMNSLGCQPEFRH